MSIKVAILGSGNIGCDLLMKCLKETQIEVVSFSGRHNHSKGLRFASGLGVHTTDRSIDGIINYYNKPDVIIDATSAICHKYHYEVAKKNKILIIDMTPANLGISCCPAINLDECLKKDNINMISCGGQASIPICSSLKSSNCNLSYIEVVSTISSLSTGIGTRINISEYITTTEKAITNFTGIKNVKVIINISPALPPVTMKTSIFVESKEIINYQDTVDNIRLMSDKTREYVKGFKNIITLKTIGEKTLSQIEVLGSGDYLPEYAGNLEIINCAALNVIKNL